MIIHIFEFDTENEARAFAQGVDFVNDSSLGGLMTHRDIDTEKWNVEVYDYDSSEGESEEGTDDDI
jgi:hypothetical protein